MVQGNGQHGGYRRPENPAALSGPGKYARRTDGQPRVDLPNAAYGENAQYQQLQTGAPLAGGQSLPSAPGGGGGAGPMPGVTPLTDPSQQPGTPVTAGAALGAGPGQDALGLPTTPSQLSKADAQALRSALPAMITAASSPGSTQSYRQMVRELIANL